MAITQNGVLQKDDNGYPVMGGTSSVDDSTIIDSAFDPSTRRLLVDSTGGGGGFTLLTPTGSVNSINTAFVFSQKPTYIISDGAWYRENKGWTWSGSTATMTVPPSDDLYGFV